MQLLMSEMFKTINYLNSIFMNGISLQSSAPYTQRNVNTFIIPIIHCQVITGNRSQLVTVATSHRFVFPYKFQGAGERRR